MPRKASAIVLFILLLAVCGCSGSPNAPASVPQEASEPTEYEALKANYCIDRDVGLCSFGAVQMFETEESIYYSCRESAGTGHRIRVYFSDKQNKGWMPLCGRPNCMHNDENCCSILESDNCGEIWLYGSRIYYLNGSGEYPELWSMGLDGNDHAAVLTIEPDDDIKREKTAANWLCAFQGKYLLVGFIGGSISAADPYAAFDRSYYIVDLSKPKPAAERAELEIEGGMNILCGSGEKLYSANASMELYEIDLGKKSSRLVCTLPYLELGNYGLVDGKLYLCSGFDFGSIVAIDVNTGEITEVNTAPGGEKLWYNVMKSGIIGSSVTDEEMGISARTELYTLGGELTAAIDGKEYNGDIMISYFTDRYVFGFDYVPFGRDQISDPPAWYLDLNEVGTDAFAWHRWQPES